MPIHHYGVIKINPWIKIINNRYYRLKKLKGWFEKDSEEFTVLCFGEHNIVGCVSPDGERYVFDKDFLIDPEKLDEIYADITITKG